MTEVASPMHKRMAVQSDLPSLTPAFSASDSDDTDTTQHHERLAADCFDETCIADKITTFFCPFDHHELPVPETPKACVSHLSEDHSVKSQALMGTETYGEQLFELLQSWMIPCQNEAPKLAHKPIHVSRHRHCRPHSRLRHLRSMLHQWHEPSSHGAHPLRRVKSMEEKELDMLGSFEESLCYDSDPEFHVESRCSNPSSRKSTGDRRQPERKYQRRRPPKVDTSIQEKIEDRSCQKPRHARGDYSFFAESPRTTMLRAQEVGIPDMEGAIVDMVQEFKNARMAMVWHRHEGLHGHSPSRLRRNHPVAVNGWVDTGAFAEDFVIQPTLTWTPSRVQFQTQKVSHRSAFSMDLLSIVRVIPLPDNERDKFPFARPNRSIFLVNNENEVCVFEMKSEYQRDWVMHGLKLVVARLASIVIVRDENMLLEFLDPFSSGVSNPLEQEVEPDEEILSSQQLDQPDDHLFGSIVLSTTQGHRETLWGWS